MAACSGSAGHARSGTRTDVVAWRPTDTGSSSTRARWAWRARTWCAWRSSPSRVLLRSSRRLAAPTRAWTAHPERGVPADGW